MLKTAKKERWDWARHMSRKKNWANKIIFWQIMEITGERKKEQKNTRWRDGFPKLLMKCSVGLPKTG